MRFEILIAYATQSGNSRHVAGIIQSQIPVSSQIISVEELSLKSFQTPGVYIFVCASYGNGDFPFCAQHFSNTLNSGVIPQDFFNKSHIAIFGMGDSSYQKYNAASYELYKSFESNGANMIGERGLGNVQDKDGYYTALYPWIDEIKPKILDLVKNSEDLKERDFELIETPNYTARVASKTYLTPDGYEPAMLEVGFEFQEQFDFDPGDTIVIKPCNSNSEKFCRFMELENEQTTFISDKNRNENLETESIEACASKKQISQGEYIKKHMSFNSLPFYNDFKDIYNFLELHNFKDEFFKKPTPENKENTIKAVQKLSTDFEFFYSYIKLGKRSYFDVFKDLNLKLPFEFLQSVIPEIVPRYFTLTKKDGLYYLTITLVQYEIGLRKKKGLCSEYLTNIPLDTKITCKIGKSNLDYSHDKLLFICTGSGITLPRSFWCSFPNKKIIVFFGHRYNEKDKIYADEMEKLSNVTTFYSTSQEEPMQYIQSVFESEFNDSIDDYMVFVSGRTRLNREVRQMFKRKYDKNVYFQAETW